MFLFLLSLFDKCQFYPVQIKTENKTDIPLKLMDINMNLEGSNLQIDFRLQYRNNNPNTLTEAKLIFPMDTDMTVSDVFMSANNKTFISYAEEKQKASETYNEMKTNNKTALLVSQKQDRLSINLCAIPPNSDIDISFTMYTSLPTVFSPSNELFFNRVSLPLTLFPRYKLTPNTGSEQAPETVIGSPTYKFNLKFTIPKDSKFETKMEDYSIEGNVMTLKTIPTTDFNVDVFLNKNPVSVKEITGNTQVVNFKINPLNYLSNRKTDVKSIVFLLDCSGSMTIDNRIENAIKAMDLFLHSLEPGVKFEIVRFGSTFNSLFDFKLTEYNDDSLNTALAFIKGTSANLGGTEIFNPIKQIYNELSPDVLFVLTDGAVDNSQAVLDFVRDSSTKIFSLGLGAGADMNLVRNLASFTGGVSEHVLDASQLRDSIIRLLEDSTNPTLSNVQIESDCGQPMAQNFRTIPRNSFYELFYYGKAGKCQVKITGESSGEQKEIVMSSDDAQLLDTSKLLHSVFINRATNNNKLTEKETIDLAKRFNIMTRYTSLVLYDNETKHEGISKLEEVDVPVEMFARKMVARAPPPLMNMAKAAPLQDNIMFAANIRRTRSAGAHIQEQSFDGFDADAEKNSFVPEQKKDVDVCDEISSHQKANGDFNDIEMLVKLIKLNEKIDEKDRNLMISILLSYAKNNCAKSFEFIIRKCQKLLESNVGADEANKLLEKASKLIGKN